MFRFSIDFQPKATLKHLHTSSNSVEINSVRMSFALPDAHCAIGRRASRPLTHFNNKNRCPTSAGTGTLLCQIPMYHPLNPLKSVPPLGHLSLKKGYISPGTNLNVLNFMFRFFIDLRWVVLASPPQTAPRATYAKLSLARATPFSCEANLPKNSSIIRAFENSVIRKRLKALNLFIPTLSPMWGCLSVLNHIRVAKQSWPPSLRA